PSFAKLSFARACVLSVLALRAFCEDFAAHLSSRLGERLIRGSCEGEAVSVRVLDASTNRKISQHLIADAFVANVAAVRDLVAEAVASFPDLARAAALVDTQIYERNHNLRIAWCSKPHAPEGVLRVLGAAAEELPFAPELLFATMIQSKSASDKVYLFREALAPPATGAVSRNHGPAQAWVVPAAILDHYVRLCMGPQAEISSARCRSGRLFQCVVLRGACPFREGVPHRSNNQYCNVRVTAKGALAWFCCSDEECPAIRYQEMDVSALLMD
ncbi:Hypothetical Protein FCC1311_117722, partial [Hondaea fermentalgiana]